jgi:hypothetical protein
MGRPSCKIIVKSFFLTVGFHQYTAEEEFWQQKNRPFGRNKYKKKEPLTAIPKRNPDAVKGYRLSFVSNIVG